MKEVPAAIKQIRLVHNFIRAEAGLRDAGLTEEEIATCFRELGRTAGVERAWRERQRG